jgi:arsenite methyltransferase
VTAHIPEQLKACCAAAYGSDIIALLLGDSYHPGGRALTRRLADGLGLHAGAHVLDVAGGPGATARLLAGQYHVCVDGIDLSPATVDRARRLTDRGGLSDRARFHVGDAERLPFPDGRFDAVVCECAFCTFPDKPTAAGELARVLRPGGRVGIADVTVRAGGLPPELTGLAGWVACLADARPPDEYAAIVTAAGLRVIQTERHDLALQNLIDQIVARLAVLRITRADRLATAGIDIDTVLGYARLAARSVAAGDIGYALLIAAKPGRL